MGSNLENRTGLPAQVRKHTIIAVTTFTAATLLIVLYLLGNGLPFWVTVACVCFLLPMGGLSVMSISFRKKYISWLNSVHALSGHQVTLTQPHTPSLPGFLLVKQHQLEWYPDDPQYEVEILKPITRPPQTVLQPIPDVNITTTHNPHVSGYSILTFHTPQGVYPFTAPNLAIRGLHDALTQIGFHTTM